ncbi:IclR family transcriptional regulator [Xinfangfangia sp. CPCC 101601]|uniref:IclR family transcriptional regulator n=1 Tax=Pseudogemmobacter lacusdianii TaxID=3069608 RepID=A0ABU0VU02_9RHOB|nr:IclR family transcriptional regulator [Xinfangfangia sp. CPCC 101601]MDQ2065212.1 IclR family transcriptional regulator [Xinfangfangia sp. CPCC 101601]
MTAPSEKRQKPRLRKTSELDTILPRNTTRGVQSIEIGGKLLAALAEASGPMMLKDLAQLADMPPAQAHAYLVSYRRIGLVEQDETSGRYQPGGFALDLAIGRMSGVNAELFATEFAQELSQRLGLSLVLASWGPVGPVVTSMVEGAQQIHMNSRAGSIYSISGTATGQLFAAYLPIDRVQEALRLQSLADLRNAIVGKPRPMPAEDLAQIRAQGFATLIPPTVPGVMAISAPVFDEGGQIRLALTLICSEEQLDSAGWAQQLPQLIAAARHLSQQLGHQPAR